MPLFERTIEKSSQLAVRWIVVLVFALALLASELGLDLLLGGFAAGLITRQVLQTREVPALRLEAHRGRVRRLHPVLLRRQRHAARRRRAVRERRPASRSSRSSSCCSSSCAARRRCCSTAACSPLREDRMALALFTLDAAAARASRSRPSRSTAGTCAPRPPPRWSAPARCRRSPARSTACACAGSRRERRAAGERRRRGAGQPEPAGHAATTRSAPPAGSCAAAHLAELGDVGPGARRQRRRGRAGARAAGPRRAPRRRRQPADRALAPAQAIFGALAGGMITFTGIVFSAVFVAAQIQTSSYSPRLAARLRRDPVVIAGLALPDRHRQLLARSRSPRSAARPTRSGRDFVPAATVLFGLVLALVTLGAFVALVQRAFESTQIGGILRTLMRRGVRRDRRRPPARRRGRRTSPRRRPPTPARRRSRTRARRP